MGQYFVVYSPQVHQYSNWYLQKYLNSELESDHLDPYPDVDLDSDLELKSDLDLDLEIESDLDLDLEIESDLDLDLEIESDLDLDLEIESDLDLKLQPTLELDFELDLDHDPDPSLKLMNIYRDGKFQSKYYWSPKESQIMPL